MNISVIIPVYRNSDLFLKNLKIILSFYPIAKLLLLMTIQKKA